MGRPASCHKALALFTLTGGAPMLVSYARRLAKPMHFEVGVQGTADPSALPEELQGVRQLTQWYNTCIEQIIRIDPTQYWWVHRRWREKPKKRYRKAKKLAA
jgi:KDO2-lipid IV(A) lauroyltransferase